MSLFISLTLFLTIACYVCANSQNCEILGKTTAVCEASSSELCTNLSSDIIELRLHYSEPIGSFKRETLEGCEFLEVLHISGQISTIQSKAFTTLARLRSLTITHTLITDLPADLFHVNSSLKVLNLEQNKLQKIPVQLFNQSKDLEVLNVADNCIRRPPCSNIGDEFKELTKLKTLNVAGLTLSSTCRSSVVATFFTNVNQNLTQLNLSRTKIVSLFSKRAIDYFNVLEVLDLSELTTFTTCPKNAWFLFVNLPKTLTTLYMQRWRSIYRPRPSCYVTARTLSGLQKLPNLQVLSMRFSDSIFGPVLDKSMFADFNALKVLDIGWCRIWNVEYYAFDKCPVLQTINLDGNPIGSKSMRLQLRWKNIQSLSLQHISVSLDYRQTISPAVRLQFSPILESIDLSGNFLHKSPLYTYRIDGRIQLKDVDSCLQPNTSEVYVRNTPNLQSINLNNNYLTHLLPEETTLVNLVEICKNISNLTSLSVENNQLELIIGLCSPIKMLKLKNNNIGKRWELNSITLAELSNLEYLDLSQNAINFLQAKLFSKMAKLKELYLQVNNISFLPSKLFYNNQNLNTLQLSFNQLTCVDGLSITRLHHLSSLDLQRNSLSQFSEALLEDIDKSSLQIFNIIGNEFLCGCDSADTNFREWLGSETRSVLVPKYQQLRCRHKASQLVHNFTRDNFSCYWVLPTILIPALLGCIVLTVAIILPCYKYRWYISHPRVVKQVILNHLKEIRLEQECTYDAFVSYDTRSDSDIDFVVNSLIPALENPIPQESCRLFIHDRDAVIGAPKHTELCQVLAKSRKVLIILSNSYIGSPQCRGEADLAGRESYGAKYYQPGKILVIVTEAIEESAIVEPIGSLLTGNVVNVYNIRSRRVKNRVWERIRHFIAKPRHAYVEQTATSNLAASENDNEGSSNEDVS